MEWPKVATLQFKCLKNIGKDQRTIETRKFRKRGIKKLSLVMNKIPVAVDLKNIKPKSRK